MFQPRGGAIVRNVMRNGLHECAHVMFDLRGALGRERL
jgi:hypothetical protein